MILSSGLPFAIENARSIRSNFLPALDAPPTVIFAPWFKTSSITMLSSGSLVSWRSSQDSNFGKGLGKDGLSVDTHSRHSLHDLPATLVSSKRAWSIIGLPSAPNTGSAVSLSLRIRLPLGIRL